MIKLFVAIPLPESLSDILHSLSKINPPLPGVRWTRKENLHITLFFIGETDQSNLEPVCEKLSDIFLKQQSFRLEFERFELTGKRSKGSMIWARFGRTEEFSLLSNRIHDEMKNFMIWPPQHLDPIPHITLARLQKGVDGSSLKLITEQQVELPEISEAELWQSVHTKNGVIYDRLKKFPFIA